jgi:SOS-response transcriptional repressor LexA
MNENQTKAQKALRPTRAQKVMLDYIELFITENGYSPSYREIRAGLNYGSVASVALHVNNLIKRGHLIKRDRTARSIELTHPVENSKIKSNQVKPSEEKWLVEKIEHAFSQAEVSTARIADTGLDHLYVLIGALKVLGMEGAAQSFMPRLSALKERQNA